MQRARPHQARRLTSRELRVEAAVAAVFLILAIGMPIVWESQRDLDPLLAVALVASHALAGRIRVYLGAGCAMPTQLVVVPMLFLAPVASVPGLVAAGLVSAALPDVLRGRAHPERLLTAVGDAWHVIGSALVLLLAGEPALMWAAWPVIAGALAAQFAVDLVSATIREWLGRGIAPALQLRVITSVHLIDICLTPIGILAALAGGSGPFGFMVVLPLLGLLGAFASDRRLRIDDVSRRLDELRQERTRLDTAIRRIGDAFAAKPDREALADLVLRAAVEALGAEHGRVLLGSQVVDVGNGPDPAVVAAVEEARRRGRPQVLAAAADWHVIAHPLTSAGTVDDVLAIARRGRRFSPQELALFEHLAEQARIAMENVILHDRLHREATTDELTGLANHRRFQEILHDEAARGRRSLDPVALVMLDVDLFKAVNDLHGHQQGDAVLRAVAQAIAEATRGTDKAARYGGEEFAVVLPGTDAVGPLTAAETMRHAVEALRVPLEDGSALRVTVSAGVSASAPGLEDPVQLVAAADGALYDAKRAGRNRTVVGRRPSSRFVDSPARHC